MGTDESIKAHEIPWSYCMNVHLPASLCSFFFRRVSVESVEGFNRHIRSAGKTGMGPLKMLDIGISQVETMDCIPHNKWRLRNGMIRLSVLDHQSYLLV